jgi:hypothetical protein
VRATLERRIDELCGCIENTRFKLAWTAKMCSFIPFMIQQVACKRLTVALTPLFVAIFESADTEPEIRQALRTALLSVDIETGFCAFRDALSADEQAMLLAVDARLLQLCLRSSDRVLRTNIEQLCARYDHVRFFLYSQPEKVDVAR